MATFTLCRFPHPEAELLGHLSGVQQDLDSTKDFLELIGPEPAHLTKLSVAEIDAFWTAALVRYMRCFSGGIRFWPRDEFLASLDEAHRSWHDHFDDVRDKFYAHSVNDMESNMPTVSIRVDDDGSKQVGGVTIGTSRVLGFSPSVRSALLDLVSIAHQWVSKLIESECSRLTTIARAMDPEELFANGMVDDIPGSGAVNKARRWKPHARPPR